MARASTTDGLSLAQIERLLRKRRTEIARLTRKRDRLQSRLDAVNQQLAAVSGGPGGAGGAHSRARNEVSLQDTLVQVMGKGGPMSVSDILDGVLATGYRSHSANFRGIVNQTLIKDKRFNAVRRGVYQMKK